MISKTIKRYVWLLNLLIEHGRLTFEETDLYWIDSPLSEGKVFALRTFHEHRKAIEELFGVEICRIEACGCKGLTLLQKSNIVLS